MFSKHCSIEEALSQITTFNGELTIGVTGDIHLYHPRVTTRRIIHILDSIYDKELLSLLDILIFNGDVFDRRMSMDSEEWQLILDWIGRILRRCKKHGVKLIVLEGTRSHDHKQSTLFQFVNNLAYIDADLHYYNTLRIVDIANNVNALFVPDEVNHDASVTASQVNELLQQRAISKVDFAFMHGMFRYQAPIETLVSHNEQYYSSIVTKRVVINHIHTPSEYGIIKAPGSPARLKQGEEETKGHYVVSIKGDEIKEWFIETKNNVIFKTLSIEGLELNDVYALLESLEYEEGSNLRLTLTRQCPAYASLREIKSQFHYYKITEQFTDSKVTPLGDGDDLIEIPSGIVMSLTEDVILDCLRKRVGDKFNDPLDKAELEKLLSGYGDAGRSSQGGSV